MKIQVVFDVQGGYTNDWKFASYLAEILDLPENNAGLWNITGIDEVKVLTTGEYKCLDCKFEADTAIEMNAHIDEHHPEAYG